jgi:hypothetical protein
MDKCADACTSTSVDQPCGGTVLRCLTEKLEEVTDAECKKEVFYFIKMEASLLPLRDSQNEPRSGAPTRVSLECYHQLQDALQDLLGPKAWCFAQQLGLEACALVQVDEPWSARGCSGCGTY